LIREKKRFEEFSPNDVLGRILTHELMDKEIKHRKKIGELEAKLNNLKVKEVALHSNKTSKPTTSSKHSTSSKPTKSKSKKVEVESSTSDSSADEDEGSHVEIGDMALFMKTYKRGLKKQGYKFAKRLILVMNGIPEMKALVKRKGRKLQPWISRSFPLPQGCSTT
jgi:hypothetical protein